MEDREVVEKRTEVTREKPAEPGVKNINIGPDGSTQIQEEDVVDDPVGTTTTVREEKRTVEHEHRP
jgi:hypothetical protein